VALGTLFEGLDRAAFTSASTVDGFAAMARLLPDGLWRLSGIKALCIGEQTRKAAERHGFVRLTAEQAMLESVVEALGIEWFLPFKPHTHSATAYPHRV
jgi:uroporphyrinogen III methyltransferase/synthase